MISAIISAVIALISALPGLEKTAAALIDDIKNHNQLSQDQKDQLVAQAKKDVDDEDDKVQAYQPVPPPAPTPSVTGTVAVKLTDITIK